MTGKQAWIAAAAALMVGAVVEVEMAAAPRAPASEPDFRAKRMTMVEEQIVARGVRDPRVLQAMRETPRHLFVPEELRKRAYDDTPLPIGSRQTISQPFIVAAMTELLEPRATDRILEIGTGSGYQAAVLCGLVKEVHTIEILPELAERAEPTLAAAGCTNVRVIVGDGYQGLPKLAPFDGIIVTAAPPAIPQPLIDQLGLGARMVIPVGRFAQELLVLERRKDGIHERSVYPVRFVPMTGEAQSK